MDPFAPKEIGYAHQSLASDLASGLQLELSGAIDAIEAHAPWTGQRATLRVTRPVPASAPRLDHDDRYAAMMASSIPAHAFDEARRAGPRYGIDPLATTFPSVLEEAAHVSDASELRKTSANWMRCWTPTHQLRPMATLEPEHTPLAAGWTEVSLDKVADILDASAATLTRRQACTVISMRAPRKRGR